MPKPGVKREILKKSLALCIGIVLAFVLVEFILRLYNPFHFRTKGDKILLPINTTYITENKRNFKLDKTIRNTKNSLGFRGAERPESLANYTSIIAVGGSTTECSMLNDGKD